MLILTRRAGESVMIGDNITVTVLGVKGNQIRLGIAAPSNVTVHREEVAQRIAKETAAQAAGLNLQEAVHNGAGRGRLA